MKGKRASLKDVAELAQVNFTLVSKYLNNSPQARMKPETKERIEAAIKTLNYRPSAIARSLRSGQSKTIGLISSNLTNSYNAHVVDLVLRLSRQKGYQLLIALNDMGKGDAELIEQLFDNDVDGILLGGIVVIPGRPTFPINIYDSNSSGIFHMMPDIIGPMEEAIYDTSGTVAGLFFQQDWEEAFKAVTTKLMRKAFLLHCPMNVEKRIEYLKSILGKKRPDLIVTSGWHTMTIIIDKVLPNLTGYKPKIVCHANCTGPFFNNPYMSGVIYSSTNDLIHSSFELLIKQLENTGDGTTKQMIPACYIKAGSPDFKKVITREFQLT